MRAILFAIAGFCLIAPGCVANRHDAGVASQPSVRPGINDPLRNPDVEQYVERWEAESREIARERERIVADIGLRPGAAVADIGAGTGLFTEPFARAVGPAGMVYAVDIIPEFLEHIAQRSRDAGLKNVRTVLCKDDSVELPAESIDVAYVCDTYHHFEYPRSTLASMHRALRRGGELIVIDFERIEGVSRPFVLEHVRAGREVFTAEIEAAGFELRETQPRSAKLEENYFLRFRKRG